MRTSRRLLRQARRALTVAFLFAGCINTLMLASPLYTLQIFETVVPTASIETLVLLTLMAGAALLVLAVLEICRDRVLLRTGLWLGHVLGQHMLENGLRQDVPANDLRQDAKSLANVKSFIASNGLAPLFDAPWVPLFIAVLYMLHPKIGMFTAAVAGVLLLAALTLAAVTARLQSESQRAVERSEQWWNTLSANPQLTGALGLARGAASQWELYHRSHVSGTYAVGKRTSFIKAWVRAIRVGAQIGLYGLGAWLVIENELTPGALVAAVILLSRVLAPLEQMVTMLKPMQQAFAGYRRLKALPDDAPAIRVTAGDEVAVGRMVLNDITYYHPTRRSPALKSVTLALLPGECLGIVGPNGAGKSTLAAVLAGAIVPTGGSAELDGVPIARWQRGEGAPPVGYLPDEPALVEGTVHENIARFNDETMAAVARSGARAGVHETLSGLQSGYATQVGQAGAHLALRERRAVALARAVHGAPRLIVLDEPEIGLDGQSLRRLVDVLRALKSEGIGIAVATQDPRLLALADKIVLLNQGNVQAFGPADQVAAHIGGRTEPKRTPAAAHAVRGTA